jgi:hypothetical protein
VENPCRRSNTSEKRNYVWYGKEQKFVRKEGGRTGDSAAKGKKAAATVQWCAAFRKTQTPSANSLTERLPERKMLFSEDFSFVNFERSTEALCADSW